MGGRKTGPGVFRLRMRNDVDRQSPLPVPKRISGLVVRGGLKLPSADVIKKA